MSHQNDYNNHRGGRGRGGGGRGGYSNSNPSADGGVGNDAPVGTNRRTFNNTTTNNSASAATPSATASNNTALPPSSGHHNSHRRGGGGSGADHHPRGRGGGGGGDDYHGGRGGGSNSHRSGTNNNNNTNTPPPQQQGGGNGPRNGGGHCQHNNNSLHQHHDSRQQQQAPSWAQQSAAGAVSNANNNNSAARNRRGSFGNNPSSATTTTTMSAGGIGNSTAGAASSSANTNNTAASSSVVAAAVAAANGASNGGAASSSSAVVPPELLLSVMDMGLDFRSYQSIADPTTGRPVVGNIVTFAADKVPDVFQPTVGLLVTMLHMYYIARGHEVAKRWINAYETVQRLFLEAAHNSQMNTSLSASFSSQPNLGGGGGGNTNNGRPSSNSMQQQQQDSALSQQARDSAIRQAEDAIRIISQHDQSQSSHPDHKLCERLLVLLDHQSGVRGGGGQVPSQRRVPPAPKATFCNLHLSDHKCHQDFSCNQVHLHQVGTIKHRVEYHSRLVQCLLGNRMTPEEADQRLRDSLFYAKYGNKVTLRCSDGSWVQFFKTLYTPQRLDLALRKTSMGMVKLQDMGGNNNNNQNGRGGPPGMGGSKPMDLNVPDAEVKSYLDEGCREVYTALEQKFLMQQQLQAQQAQAQAQAASAAAAAQAAGGKDASGGNVMQILTASMARQHGTPPANGKQPAVMFAANVANAPSSSSNGNTTTIGSHIDTPDATPAKTFQLTPSNMIPWAASVNGSGGAMMLDHGGDSSAADEALVREYVRLTGISEKEQRANEALLNALQVGSGGNGGPSASTPVTPESFTPLMHEVQMRRFGSEDVSGY